MHPRLKLTEKKGLILLLVLFIFCSAFVLSFHHSFKTPTVPDEKAYYMWAKLYNQGYMAVPLEDWFGMDPQPPSSRVTVNANSTGIHFILLVTEVLDIDSFRGENDLRVSVTWENGSPISGAEVTVRLGPNSQPLTDTTDSSGHAEILNIQPGIRSVDASVFVPQPIGPPVSLRTSDLISIGWQGVPYRTYLTVDSYSSVSGEITIRARDSFNTSMKDVEVALEFLTPTGQVAIESKPTDDSGKAIFTLNQDGNFVFVGSKDALGEGNFLPSVVRLDGRYYSVNRWPPGYQIFLAPFVEVGMEELATLFQVAIAALSCYVLTRRLFGWRAAFLGTTLLMTCALSLIMVFEVGMADYASMTFALLGIALFFEALGRESKRIHQFLFFLASGLAFAWAVWLRHSTGTVILVPLIYLVILTVKEGREEKDRYLPTKASIKRGLIRLAPFIIGLVILGVPLAIYNSTYFGSPFATGYNFGSLSIEGEGENVTGEITEGAFFENFNPGASISTLHLRLYYLLILVPFAYIMPFALWWRRRELAVWFLIWAFLATFLLYIFVPWVSSWTDNLTRSLEDMRYFMPCVPPAAMLAGVFLKDLWEKWGWRRIVAIVVMLVMVVAGFAVASVGIGLQLDRIDGRPPGQPPPSSHDLVSVQQLYDDPLVYNSTLVEVRDCAFDSWIDQTEFTVREVSSQLVVRVALEGYQAPSLGSGDELTVKGMFRWFDANKDGVPQPHEMTITVKGGTNDEVIKH